MAGLRELTLASQDFLEKVYKNVAGKEPMDWEKFLSAIKLIISESLEDKIDLFFKVRLPH